MTIFEEQAIKMKNILKCALMDGLITKSEYNEYIERIK